MTKKLGVERPKVVNRTSSVTKFATKLASRRVRQRIANWKQSPAPEGALDKTKGLMNAQPPRKPATPVPLQPILEQAASVPTASDSDVIIDVRKYSEHSQKMDDDTAKEAFESKSPVISNDLGLASWPAVAATTQGMDPKALSNPPQAQDSVQEAQAEVAGEQSALKLLHKW